jgi:hypothetical protein
MFPLAGRAPSEVDAVRGGTLRDAEGPLTDGTKDAVVVMMMMENQVR